MHHLIIGAGPAGVIAADHLRALDRDAAITIVGDEPEPPYSRMALPYLLTGNIQESGTYLRRDPEHYAARGIEVLHDRVTAIDSAQRTARLAGGRDLSWDRLLVAAGSRPVLPPIPGVDLPGVSTCWTMADARRISAGTAAGSRVVLMGAGFIGCIILEALSRRGVDLTVVEMADRMVPRMMNVTAGGLIREWCERQGVAVRVATRVTAIEPGGKGQPLRVVLEDGAALPADLVISAAGVTPNIDFLAGSGVRTDRGVLIDRHMRTSVPGIFAAGDVAQGLDFSTGEYSVQAIQPTAVDHGRLAAANMAGRAEAVHQGSVNMNVLDTLGLISSSFGLWMGTERGESTELCDRDRFRYLNLQFEDDVLVGATSLGLTEHVGVLRGLIQSRTRLGRWKERLLEDPTRIMEAWMASTQAIGFNAGLV